MRSLNEAIEFGKDNLEELEDIYIRCGREAVAKYLEMSYNSVGHVLKALGFYSDEVKEKKRIWERVKTKSRNPFLIEDEMSAYLLGFILGDGSLRIKHGVYTLDIYNNDRELMEKLIKAFFDDKQLSVRKYQNTVDGYYFDVYDQGVCNKLLEYGLRERKSVSGCSLPKVLKENEHHLIRGLFDSDGSITNNHDRGLRFYIYGHKSYMDELRVIFPVRYRDCNRPGLDGIAIYSMGDIEEIYEYLYKDATIYIDRKRRVFENVIK